MEFITEYCRLFSATVSVPFSYYDKDLRRIWSYPDQENRFDFSSYTLDQLLKITKKPACITTGSNAVFGIVEYRHVNGFLVIGPCFGIAPAADVIYAFMHEAMISVQHYPLVETLLNYSANVTHTQLRYALLFLHFSLNGEQIDMLTHFNYLDEQTESAISSLHSGQLYHLKENQHYHNTYHFEQQYLEYIRQGQTEKLKQFFLESTSFMNEGQVADDALRQAKNIFIAGTTLATRSAIAGGLDIEQAYQLSDVYIKECEKQQDSAALSTLNFSMNLDFARRVENSKIPAGMSADTFKCIQYISRHTNEAIRVEDVARHINRSRSYVSRKFKSEMGFDLSTFIMRCKLEEAKSLLTHTDKSLSEISSYLCFSSQSYFQNVFKKKYGLTPLQYRNQSMLK